MLFPKGLLEIADVVFITALSGNILHLLIRLPQQFLRMSQTDKPISHIWTLSREHNEMFLAENDGGKSLAQEENSK